MGSAWIHLTPLEELVLSERAATAGGHETLDFIPGSKLLGVASRRYQEFGNEALRVFHGGAVRFGNGRPQVGKQPGWPMPFAWHERKADPSGIDGGWLVGAKIANYQHATFEMIDRGATPVQPKQLRQGYLGADGRVIELAKYTQYRARTAIAPGQRTAEPSQFFAYESLAVPGDVVFVAPIEWDDDLSAESVAQLGSVFTGQVVRFGRSRAAEYGSCRSEWLDGPALTEARLPEVRPQLGEDVTLWVLSDLAVETADGIPCLVPTAEMLGLPTGSLVTRKTFIRTRTYSPFNGFYRAFETERTVIAQGSVLCFSLKAAWTDEHDRRVADGLGLYREAGLGRVAVNPPLLASGQPTFPDRPEQDPASERSTDATSRDGPLALVAWLENRADATLAASQALPKAIELARQYRALLGNARRYQGLATDAPVGPGASQWAMVATRARELAERRDRLRQALFEPDQGWCARGRAGWQAEIGPDQTIGRWLATQFVDGQAWRKTPLTLHYLAHEIRNALQREQLGS